MQPGSQSSLSELNSTLEDPADERCWFVSTSKLHNDLAPTKGKIRMSYLPMVGIAISFVNRQMFHVLGETEASL
jgi:hypothetical protein